MESGATPSPSLGENAYLKDQDWSVQNRTGTSNVMEEIKQYAGSDVTLPLYNLIQGMPNLVVAAATAMLLYHFVMKIVAPDEETAARHSKAIKVVLASVAMGAGLYGLLWVLFTYFFAGTQM